MQISRRRGRPPPTILRLKTRLNDLSYGIKNLDGSFFHFVTNREITRLINGQKSHR